MGESEGKDDVTCGTEESVCLGLRMFVLVRGRKLLRLFCVSVGVRSLPSSPAASPSPASHFPPPNYMESVFFFRCVNREKVVHLFVSL